MSTQQAKIFMTSSFISITGQSLELGSEAKNQGQCMPISSFERLNHLGEGTYGVVYRARNKKSSQVVALKQVRISPEDRQNGIPITTLREISILRSLKHNNIINVSDVAVGETEMDEIYMVMEYAEQVGDPMPRAFT
ncbi:Cyclin-dependent kinase 10 [Peltigera leucophlebia]|nr:Cyclin-dependent kinase 10 [Peltigera leucophlebia]